MEEEPEYTREIAVERRRRNRQSTEKIEAWLSPMSDHFPTPRGMHFMAAPVVPETPSYLTSDCEADVDVDDASSEASSSNPSSKMMWNNRGSVMTDATEFDDLYDVSDDEIQRKERLQANGISRQRSSVRSSRSMRRASGGPKRALTPLVIPEEVDPALLKQKAASPVPPTPPSAVALSPAIQTLMGLRQAQEVPRISAPPSLDGSINSEEMAAMSAPPTPMIGAQEDDDEEWSGVRLQPGALETLQALSGSESEYEEEQRSEQVIEVPQEMSEMRQQLPRLVTAINRQPSVNTQRSLAELSKLDIPTPGGFFSDLSSASRLTWNAGSQTDDNSVDNFPPPPPPRPLHLDDLPSAIVERVVEIPESTNFDDMPTAIRVEPTPVPITARRVPPTPAVECAVEEPSSPMDATEIVLEYDPEYVAQQKQNSPQQDRTEMWLMAQRSYLQGVAGFSDEAEASEAETAAETEPEVDEKPAVPPKDVATDKKKAVRFSEAILKESVPRGTPSKLIRNESAYYRAFTDATVRSTPNDVFVQRQPRFEAMQAQRVALRELHRNQLIGKFQLSVVPQSAKKRMSANVARGDDIIVEDKDKLRADKEAEALGQMNMATWHVAATKLLNGGRLIAAPVAKRLARQSRMAPGPDGVSLDRARILDLGGQGACDWAWHAALQYPNTKIYTITTKAIRQLSNSNVRGPPNHRQVAVERLTKLPFSDDQFDLISARELHAVLKLFGENGADEWDACLKECMRVLKPGGYLEFSVLDADIMNAGPLGNAKAVEFGFALQTLGYDPNPTRSFLGRLSRAGFDDVRRAWMCLPVGPKHRIRLPKPFPRDSTMSSKTVELEAIVSGSTDNVAAVTGIAAGWSWERWLLRAEMEKASGELRLADIVNPGDSMKEAGKMIADVHAVIEEGRQQGSGFRMLRGYARKPRVQADSGVIQMVLDI
ncbi:Ubiquinone/menaquinone biosynthesis C-methyltransferase UbiE [Rhypophila sp. PSN 637]